MMRKTVILALALILALVQFSGIVSAQPPSFNHHGFRGTVRIDGELAPDGTVVSAHIGSLSWSTTTADGKYGYDTEFRVPGDDSGTTQKDGGVDGDDIIFKVDGEEAATYTFSTGMFTTLNLSIGDVIYYTLTSYINPSGSGTVTLNPSMPDNEYESGSPVTLTASQASGYAFDHWSGDFPAGHETVNPLDISMNSDKSITAHFVQSSVQYQLSISSATGGSVTTPGEGTFTHNAGELVNIVASPDSGYQFGEWTGDVSAVADIDDPTTTISMDGDKNITAQFNKASAKHKLTTSSTAGGSVTTPGEGTFNYDTGKAVNIVASPDSNHKFDEWTGDISTVADINSPTTSITINNDSSITAVFTTLNPDISPASFSASNLIISAAEVQPDQQVGISITISNDGGASGSHTVILYVNSDPEDRHTVTIEPASNQDVTFTVTRSTPGTYEVSLEGQHGQFIVTDTSVLPDPPTPSGLSTGIIIAIIAALVVLIVAVALIARSRRR